MYEKAENSRYRLVGGDHRADDAVADRLRRKEKRTSVLYNVRIRNLKVSIAGAFIDVSELPAET